MNILNEIDAEFQERDYSILKDGKMHVQIQKQLEKQFMM